MYSDQTVHAGERFFKYNSMRRFPHFLAERCRPTMYIPTISEDDIGPERPPTALKCASNELARFIDELEQGRKEVEKRSVRVETALQVFARACRTFDDSWHYVPDRDEITRTVIDLWTVMEAIFAQRDDRGKRIAQRAGALLAPTDEEERALVIRIIEVKDTRNRIVHGDEPLLDDELVAAVDDLRIWTGKSLTALLRMGGDQGRMVKGQVDRELKAKNRRLVPTYAN